MTLAQSGDEEDLGELELEQFVEHDDRTAGFQGVDQRGARNMVGTRRKQRLGDDVRVENWPRGTSSRARQRRALLVAEEGALARPRQESGWTVSTLAVVLIRDVARLITRRASAGSVMRAGTIRARQSTRASPPPRACAAAPPALATPFLAPRVGFSPIAHRG